MEERITLKGSRDGLRLILNADAPWDEVLAAVRVQLDQGTTFYQGAKLLIDIGGRSTTDVALQELLGVMAEYGIEPEALITAAPDQPNGWPGSRADLAPS
jgi:septum site-determining protein MinC